MACKKVCVILLAAWLVSGPASAHSWYPVWCCSEQDCRPLIEADGETVAETPNGWKLWDGRTIPRKVAKPSPDSRFHLCEEPMTKAVICFFAPLGGS